LFSPISVLKAASSKSISHEKIADLAGNTPVQGLGSNFVKKMSEQNWTMNLFSP
jgi:hypothetical protein